jgi:hypothetical protein
VIPGLLCIAEIRFANLKAGCPPEEGFRRACRTAPVRRNAVRKLCAFYDPFSETIFVAYPEYFSTLIDACHINLFHHVLIDSGFNYKRIFFFHLEDKKAAFVVL